MSTNSTNPSLGVPRHRTLERGRPREFDEEQAVGAAARVFWEQGYHATSIDELCVATGVFRGSLYRTFGDKHGLLVAAFDQYAQGAVARLKERLGADLSPREALREALLHYTKIGAHLSGRHGCFITNAALELLPMDGELRPYIEATLRQIAEQFSQAVLQGQREGAFNTELDAEQVGYFLLCLVQGMRVLGKTDTNESRLTSIVDIAMLAMK